MIWAKPVVVFQILTWSLVVASVILNSAAEKHQPGPVSYNRRATFEVTYANRDLIWLGDAASPTALAYPKPSARPLATDFYVTTLVENRTSRSRSYFREARIVADDGTRTVHAFTEKREQLIGTIGANGQFSPNEFYRNNPELLPTWPADATVLAYDEIENALYKEVETPGPIVTESLDFLPLDVSDTRGQSVTGRFSIDFLTPKNGDSAGKSSVISLNLRIDGETITLAKASVPKVFRRAEMQLGSFDNHTGTYLPESAYRTGLTDSKNSEPSVTLTIAGEFTSSVVSDLESLTLATTSPSPGRPRPSLTKITIDGDFDDWRNVDGIDDPRGDLVPYLEYVSDVDLLEFKVAHDDEHVFLYARVAGQVGRSHPDGGRSYFYAYMDVDQNPGTGFLPTRDDECYYGVDIGDDCEVQFEFINNKFRKTFYGFCGLGGDDHVLRQQVTLGKSQYDRFDANGVEREHYKSEYIYRNGVAEITEDFKHGTSDSIELAISADGSEVEVASTFAGFLKGPDGRPTVRLGQTIDLAVGMECDSKAYIGKTKWAADSTRAIRGYRLSPPSHRAAAIQRLSE